MKKIVALLTTSIFLSTISIADAQIIWPGGGSGGGAGSGTVTSVATGCGLTGGPVSLTGTISATQLVNAQTGTTYTVLSTDNCKLVTFSNASAVAVTLPQATGSFTTGFSFYAENLGVGTVTVTPTTSTVNGSATLVIATNQGCRFVSDGTNWQVAACTALGSSASGANPTATAGPTAVNGTSTNFMRADGAPAIQKGSSSQFGIVEVDGTTITASGGVISSVSGGAGTVTSVDTGSCLTGGPVTTTGTFSGTYLINAQTGTTYTVLSTDACKLVTLSNASSIAVTLPQATGSFAAGFSFDVQNKGAGLVTITPTTSTINGAATLTIPTNMGCSIVSDGTNWQVSSCPPAMGVTGSGSIVRATSPTLVTPALGTPSAVVLTSGTGLPISTGVSGLGTGVATALGTTLSAAGGVTTTVASGTSALGTSAISSGACATVVTTTATNTATTDVVLASFNGDPTAVTGYAPVTSGMLTIISYPSANNVNFKVCNMTSSSVTPGAITLNWRVLR